MLRRFWGLFWPIFNSFCGGSIRTFDTTPAKGIKNRLKRTPKSTEDWLCKRSKNSIRRHLFAIRGQISQQRRDLAKEALQNRLLSLLKNKTVLSFCSLPQEIDTFSLNTLLAKQGSLILPRVEGRNLTLFHVTDQETQLQISFYKCKEPIPSVCASCSLDAVDYALVPALGFDRLHFRIGYGKGYYDRLIASSMTRKLRFIGIGFQEQLIEGQLPREAHDQPLDELLLF